MAEQPEAGAPRSAIWRRQGMRKMWALVDKDETWRGQLTDALDGGLYTTKPIPAHEWLKPVRVLVTIKELSTVKRRSR